MTSKMKPKLSKGILEMKFMKRTKEKVAKEEEIAEGREMYSQEITNQMLNDKCNYIIEPSFMHFEDLIDGRLSFRGMNPEIERLMELEKQAKQASVIAKMDLDVTDKEMLEQYENNLSRTIGKKFANNKSKHNVSKSAKKKKFLKPKSDDE